jgi:hypothetical protein
MIMLSVCWMGASGVACAAEASATAKRTANVLSITFLPFSKQLLARLCFWLLPQRDGGAYRPLFVTLDELRVNAHAAHSGSGARQARRLVWSFALLPAKDTMDDVDGRAYVGR